MAEHLIRNEAVGGSTPPISSRIRPFRRTVFFFVLVGISGVEELIR